MIESPHCIDAEKEFLGNIIHSFESVCGKLESITPSHFYEPKHGVVYSAILELIQKGSPINQSLLLQHLQDNGKLKKAGGHYEITGFEPSTGLRFESNQSRIMEMYKRRQLQNTAKKVINESDTLTSEEIQKLLFDTIQKNEGEQSGGFISISDSVQSVIKDVSEIHKSGKPSGLKMGFVDLDKIIGGMDAGEIIIVGGRPSMGKTAFALSIALKVAGEGHPIGIFSLEMTTKSLTERLICQKSRIDATLVKQGGLTKTGLEVFSKGGDEISKLPIYIEDSMSSDILQVLSRARFLIKMKKIKLLIIDYLQLLKSGKNDNRYNDITNISRELKILAITEKIPVMLLSQLNRKAEGRMPNMADLRDSGGIEQDADKIIFIRRPELDGEDIDEEGNSNYNIADIKVAKNRNGATGQTKLTFIKEITAFENISHSEELTD